MPWSCMFPAAASNRSRLLLPPLLLLLLNDWAVRLHPDIQVHLQMSSLAGSHPYLHWLLRLVPARWQTFLDLPCDCSGACAQHAQDQWPHPFPSRHCHLRICQVGLPGQALLDHHQPGLPQHLQQQMSRWTMPLGTATSWLEAGLEGPHSLMCLLHNHQMSGRELRSPPSLPRC